MFRYCYERTTGHTEARAYDADINIFIIIFYQQIDARLACLSSLVHRRLLASSWHSPRALIVVTNTKAYTVNAERRAYVYRSNCRVAETGSFRDVIDRKSFTVNANIISNTSYMPDLYCTVAIIDIFWQCSVCAFTPPAIQFLQNNHCY